MQDNIIQVFEHEKLSIGEKGFTLRHHNVLSAFAEKNNCSWFRIGFRCIHFANYVGVINIDGLTIEILPKIDKNESVDVCQKHLIDMLCKIGKLKLSTPTQALLRLKKGSVLDLYIAYFIYELQRLIRMGLIRRYQKIEGNQKALKGKLLVGKQIRNNIVHKERFYCEFITYNKDHLLHRILYATLNMLLKYSGARPWLSEIRSVSLNFPECKSIKVDESLFDGIIWDRKNKVYAEAIKISRMFLLNFHPDLSSGKEDVLALLFNMNELFEAWVLKSLKKAVVQNEALLVYGQNNRRFWTNELNGFVNVRPDIVVFYNKTPLLIFDTKWKRMKGNDKPSANDLQQLFAYNKLFDVSQSYLIYPEKGFVTSRNGWFGKQKNNYCGVYMVKLVKEGKLNTDIGEELLQQLILPQLVKKEQYEENTKVILH